MINDRRNTYNKLNISFTKGKGVWLWDIAGNKYLDAFSGFSVNNLGYAHPVIVKTIKEQASKLLHVANIFHNPLQIDLESLLSQFGFTSKAFFSNSGSEAIEIAIKLMRLYGNSKKIQSPKIVVMENAYHGCTLATSSASRNFENKEKLGPFLDGFVRVSYNNISSLKQIAKEHPEIIALLVEPIQGAGGIKIPDANYLAEIRALCDHHQWLLALDEVQTGMGRTGRLFAYQHSHIQPDILILAKGIGSGIPLGVCLAKENIASLLTMPRMHNSTFAGNYLAMATAIATVKEIVKHKLWENAEKQGLRLLNGLKNGFLFNENVKEVRGQGLMLAIEFKKPLHGLIKSALDKRLLIHLCNPSTIRLLPPLIIQEKEINQIIDILLEICA